MIKRALLFIGLLATSASGADQFFIKSTSALQSGATFYVSSGTAINFNASTATITTIPSTTITNLAVSSMTSTLPMSGRKITGLANGTLATDAMAFGQNKFIQWKSSSTTAGTSTTNSTPVNTFLGITITPTSALNHILIFVSGGLSNPTLTNTAKLYISGNNAGNPGLNVANFQPPASATARVPASFIYDDGAAGTTSPVTFTVQISAGDNSNTVSFLTGAGERAFMIAVEAVP
jgi:hypothetical protein